MTDSAPIALFIFKRTNHLLRTIRALQRCAGFHDTKIIVFADGPRTPQDASGVGAARVIARELLGESAEFRFNETNLGLARSIITGVRDVVSRFGRVIVLEDDLEVSRGFLTYMNAALGQYAAQPTVMQISGHMFGTRIPAGRRSAILLPFTTTWGWATWQRAWDLFDPLAQGWERLAADQSLRKRFNLYGSYDYASMLERQMRGHADSWGIRWYWSVFKNSGVVCFPPASMVRNIGMDGSGTHGRGLLRRFRTRDAALYDGPVNLPAGVSVDCEAFESVRRAIWRQNGSCLGVAADRARRLLQSFGAARK